MTSALHTERLDAVMAAVATTGARRIADLGCGDGDLLVRLALLARMTRLVGVDTDRAALLRAQARLAEMPTGLVTLVEASLIAAAPRLPQIDCAVLVEVIEHLDPARLSALETAVFARMRPAHVILTTPNAEFNPLLGVPAHRMRHPGHRFEWTRARFARWAGAVALRHGYDLHTRDIAGHHPTAGGASQMAVFARSASPPREAGAPPAPPA
ncbi:methyltransferase [Rhodobaculum claviforme]|uniref:Small RNA 2'-O-methyltransferase n=1 Tax=Rhodobaculum claviforme TaxID=1549854 RepID=A0A934WI04_9RHOB|nr:methyltransferase [Rhodobaculum claviforme]MBK5926399.1 methyltransferase type 12 [Rhodobaculum claviforme]